MKYLKIFFYFLYVSKDDYAHYAANHKHIYHFNHFDIEFCIQYLQFIQRELHVGQNFFQLLNYAYVHYDDHDDHDDHDCVISDVIILCDHDYDYISS